MLQALFSQLIINFYSNFEANFESRVMQFSDYEDPISVYPLNVSQDLNGIFEKYGKLVDLGSSTKQYDNISEGLLNVGKDATTRNGDIAKKFVEFLIIFHSQSNVTRNDTRFFVITCSVSSQLKDFGAKIFEDCN